MKKIIIIGGAAAFVVYSVVSLLSGRQQTLRQAVLPPARAQPSAPVPRPEPLPVEVASTPANQPLVQPVKSAVPKMVKTTAPKPPALDPRWSDPAAKEAMGRIALSFVGADANAEDVWLWAINDPNLPEESRKNLIEDLNEDGLSDPKNPGPQDLPLIENRLRLIAELAPYAMDQINRDAFMEAGKDLYKMYTDLAH